jgi:hypothetical protein
MLFIICYKYVLFLFYLIKNQTMKVKLKKINKIDTSDVLYDLKLEQFVIYPQNVDIGLFDVKYIKENCCRLTTNSKQK